MRQVFIGSETLARGGLTPAALRWNHRRLFPDVYVPAAITPSLHDRAFGAWLWSRRNGVIAGRAAAAMHGARWVDSNIPVELIFRCSRPPPGIVVRNERIDSDEVTQIGGLLVTSVLRTAFDLARHLPRNEAVVRGARRAATALSLMDGGAQSPRETRLRLVLVDEWLDPVRTQIKLADGSKVAYLDMGYDEPMVGLDYEGSHHSTDRGTYVYDIGRAEFIEQQGWHDIRVVSEHSAEFIKFRVRQAFGRRGYTPRLRQRS